MRKPIFAGMAALTLGLLAACAPQSDAAIVADIEKGIMSEPDAKIIFTAMRETYPEEYKALVDQALAATKARMNDTELEQMGSAFMDGFLRRNLADAATAPDENVTELRRVRLRALRTLKAQSVALCAQSAMNEPLTAEVPGRRQKLEVAQVQAALFGAMAAGKRNPVKRPALSEQDSIAFYNRVNDGRLSEADFAAMTGNMLGASDETQCNVEFAVLEALAEMPDDQANRLMIAILTENAR